MATLLDRRPTTTILGRYQYLKVVSYIYIFILDEIAG